MQGPLFSELTSLFGRSSDDALVGSFLEEYECKLGKPVDGLQDVVCKKHGFDLVFAPATGMQGGPTKLLRVLTTIFLFPDGREKHKQFDDLPFGLSFGADTIDRTTEILGAPVKTFPQGGCWKVDELAICAGRGREIAVYSWSFYEEQILAR